MSKFVSFSNLPETLEVKDNRVGGPVPLVFDMELPPHVDQDRLQLNVPRLKAMHRVGAISASVVGSYEGDITQTTPNVVGINADGSAIAGRSAVTKKAQRSKQFLGDVEHVDTESGWTVLAHRVNRPEAADMVVERTREGESSEKAWGSALDEILRQSLREGGKQHLVQRTPLFWRNMLYLSTSICLSDTVLLSAQAKPSMGAAWYVLFQVLPEAAKKVKGIESQRRLSIVPFGSQPDRYLALNGLSRLPGLVRSRE